MTDKLNKKIERNLKLAIKFINEGKFRKSERILKKTIILDSYYAPIYRELGLVYFHQYRLQDAISEYKRALSIDEEDPETHYRLGTVYYYQGKVEQAIKEYNRCLEIDNKFAKAYYSLGIIYEAKGEIELAFKMVNQAVNISPEAEFDRLEPGKVKIKRGERITIDYLVISLLDTIKIYLQSIFTSYKLESIKKEAKKIVKKLTFEEYYQAGLRYKELKNYKKAELNFKKALELRPQDINCINELGLVYFNQNRLTQAEEQFKKAIHLQPQFALSHYHIGCVYYQKRLLDKAEECFNKAIELDKGLAPAYYSLGLTYEKKGKVKQALNFMEKAMSLVPDVKVLVQHEEEIEETVKGSSGCLIAFFKLSCLTLLHIPLAILEFISIRFYDKIEKGWSERIIIGAKDKLNSYIERLEK